MRKIFVTILFSSFLINTFAQTYTPMLENGKIWNMKYETWTVGIPNSTITTNYGYFIDGTTTFNSITYFILRDSRNTNVYYLREEAANKKVYLYDTATNAEKLLYDFNVQVGDVFNASKLNTLFTAAGRTVVAISTELKFGINTKFYTLSDTNNSNCIKVYEGIGFSPEGLIDDPIWCSTFDPNYRYTLTNINQTLAVDDYTVKNTFFIFFDSATKQLKSNKPNQSFKIKMFSTLGQKILDTQLKSTLDVSQLKKGLYYYALDTDKTTFKGKLLIY